MRLIKGASNMIGMQCGPGKRPKSIQSLLYDTIKAFKQRYSIDPETYLPDSDEEDTAYACGIIEGLSQATKILRGKTSTPFEK